MAAFSFNGSFLEAISTVLAIVGELSLTVWLLLWGGKKEASQAAGVHA